MIAVAPLAAGEYSFNSNSLFAIEGGGSSLSADRDNLGITHTVEEKEFGHIGLKVGAETETFRAFIGANYYIADELSSLGTAGASLQYKFNFSDPVDFFIGGNVGMAYLKVKADGTNPSDATTTSYIGGDAGFNIHATETIDFELGARYMQLNEELSQGPNKYTFNHIASAYASVIFKFKMD